MLNNLKPSLLLSQDGLPLATAQWPGASRSAGVFGSGLEQLEFWSQLPRRKFADFRECPRQRLLQHIQQESLGTPSPLQVLLYSYYALLAVLLPITAAAEPSGFLNLAHYSKTVWLGMMILAVFQYFLSMVIF